MEINNLLGLIFECPFTHELDSCPLEKIRKLSIEARLSFVKELSHEHINKILTVHKVCLANRESIDVNN